MTVKPYIDELDQYLISDKVIDFDNPDITELVEKLSFDCNNEIEYIKKSYEFVRDNISHSADIKNDLLTCSASDVLKAGHGICFAKSHLFAALLRCKGIPTGLCYQKLILDDEEYPYLVLHGFNGVYLKEYDKWIRLDPRGNKEGVNAQFSLDEEHLAFPVRSEFGEEDYFTVFPEPDKNVLMVYDSCSTRTELWSSIPSELFYLTGEIKHVNINQVQRL